MKARISAIAALAISLSFPIAASAISYLPGQTLDPSCAPSDPTCIVVPNTTSGSFIATSSTATSTFAGSIQVAGTASTTNAIVSGSLTLGNLNGILRAVAGVITSTLVNLTSDVTGVLGISNGGTGISVTPSYGQVLVGNGSGGYNLVATSSLGVAAASVAWGNVTGTLSNQNDLQNALNAKFSLASWYATTTDALAQGSTNKYFSNALAQAAISVSGGPLTYSSGVVGINQASGSQAGYLASADWANFNGKVSSSSLSASFPLAYNSATGVFTTAFSTTTANTFSNTNVFNGNVTLSNATSTNFFATTASSTNLSAQTASIGALTLGSGTTTAGNGFNITSGCFSFNGTCITGGGGGGVASLAATYPLLTTGATGAITISTAFGTTTANIWSNLQTFQSGYIAQASSTIIGPFTVTGVSTLSGLLSTVNASTTNLTASGELYSLTASTTNLTVGTGAGFLKANAAGVVSATSTFSLVNNVFGTLGIGFGGTGLSSTPSYGQLLVGNAGGGFTLTSTSSLGISGGGGTWGSITGTLANQTDLQNALNLKLSSSSLATSALLAGLVSDETGSGSLVFASSPTFAGTPVFGGGLVNYSVNSTTTIPNGNPYAWTIATSSTANPLIEVDTSGSTGSVSIGASSSSLSTVEIGSSGNPAFLLFAASSTIEGAGTGQQITIGANGDILNFGVNVGIGTTSPGSLFSLGGLANFTTATSTFYSTGGINLTEGCFSINGTCITGSGGGGGVSSLAATYPLLTTGATGAITISSAFGTTTANTWSNLQTFTSGFISNASTTIGNGTQAGGLTIAGGATTTGNAIFNLGAIASSTFVVGANGPTNPVFQIFASTTNAANGLSLTSTLAGGGVTLQTISSTANEPLTISSKGTGALNLFTQSTGGIYLTSNNSGADNTIQITSGGDFFNIPSTGGGDFTFQIGANTNIAANTESNYVNYNLASTETHSNGTIALQRSFLIQAPTEAFNSFNAGKNNITNLAAFAITGAPLTGKNGTTTNAFSALIGSSTPSVMLNASTTNSYGLGVFANGGAQNNYAAEFLGGYVGVGTSTPTSQFEVWGPDTASTSVFAVVNSASTTEFTVYDTGNATLAGSLVQNSDERLKTNIQDLDGSSSLAAINALNPVTFNWIDPNKSSVPQFGFIAQQVQTIFPNLIATTAPTALTPDGTLSLNYIDLISPIVSAIQELDQELTSLASTVASFAASFTTKILNSQQDNTQELCVGSTCVTPQQFAAMVAAANQQSARAAASPSSPSPDSADTPPVIQINGDNPAIIQVGTTYSDLGATITGPQADLNLGISTYVNGVEMTPVRIDTGTAATDTIDYVVTDSNGDTATSTRTVIIQPPITSASDPGTSASTTPVTATSTTP